MQAMDGAHAEVLLADLDQAIAELETAAHRDPALWGRAVPGHWTAGQHVAHVAITVNESADMLESRAGMMAGGRLPPKPRRGLLAWLWVRLVIAPGRLPRGGKTAPRFVPPSDPPLDGTLTRLRRDLERHRALTLRLTPIERERLWMPNPFLPRWHYTLPEMLRVHAVHARHHAKLIAEIA